MRLQEEKREVHMILLVQNAIKRRSQIEFEEREQALEELELLRQQERHRQKSPRLRLLPSKSFILSESQAYSSQCNEEDLKRQYQLQEETEQRIKSEKERLMLLRPDSTFVFRYQLLYLACALIETVRRVLMPWLEKDVEPGEETLLQRMARFLLSRSHVVTHAVLCVGVIVWVFVGVPDPVTGRLVRRASLERWFYAGLLLQVFLNPALLEVKYLVKFIGRAGPGRVCRWWILFLFPLWRKVLIWLEWHIWMRLVQRENQRLVAVTAFRWMPNKPLTTLGE